MGALGIHGKGGPSIFCKTQKNQLFNMRLGEKQPNVKIDHTFANMLWEK